MICRDCSETCRRAHPGMTRKELETRLEEPEFFEDFGICGLASALLACFLGPRYLLSWKL